MSMVRWSTTTPILEIRDLDCNKEKWGSLLKADLVSVQGFLAMLVDAEGIGYTELHWERLGKHDYAFKAPAGILEGSYDRNVCIWDVGNLRVFVHDTLGVWFEVSIVLGISDARRALKEYEKKIFNGATYHKKDEAENEICFGI